MTGALQLLPRRAGRPSPMVTVERHLVVGAAMNAEALATDIEVALEAIAQRMFAGNRAGVLNEIGRAHRRVQEMRGAFLDLAGIADLAPTDPPAAAAA